MAIGINDLDFDDNEYGNESVNDTTTQDTDLQDTVNPETIQTLESDDATNPDQNAELDDRGIISEFLKSKGIEDISKIKYEDEDGQEEEIDWETLDSSEKLSILNQLNSGIDDNLDDSELQLINAIRNSRMSPSEYLNYIAQRGADQYAQSLQENMQVYEIDQYSDEDLFITDLITRMGRENITDDEAREALDRAKANEALFKKQASAIRNEYKKIEDENRQYALYLDEQRKQEQYNQFANSIKDQIIDFNEFQGFELNMDQDDKEELYDFITGFDEAGNSILGKAINDPSILVKMAWFALHGEQMLDDISDYVKQQVTKVRKDSYNKGVEDARAGKVKDGTKKSVTTYKPKSNTNVGQISINDLD